MRLSSPPKATDAPRNVKFHPPTRAGFHPLLRRIPHHPLASTPRPLHPHPLPSPSPTPSPSPPPPSPFRNLPPRGSGWPGASGGGAEGEAQGAGPAVPVFPAPRPASGGASSLCPPPGGGPGARSLLAARGRCGPGGGRGGVPRLRPSRPLGDARLVPRAAADPRRSPGSPPLRGAARGPGVGREEERGLFAAAPIL